MATKPYKFGIQKRKRFLELLREGARRGSAAQQVGITRETARLAYRDDKAFAEQVETAELDATEQVEAALYQKAIAGNVRACLQWLYSRSPQRWRRNPQPHIEQDDGDDTLHYCDRCNCRIAGEHPGEQ